MPASQTLNSRYRVVRRLGDGSEGSVYLVEDRHRESVRRALKLVSGLEPSARDRVAGEFARLATLDHPNLVRVYDLETVTAPIAGFAASTPFFTSDYVGDRDLLGFMEALAPAERARALLDAAEDVAAALAHVHAAGLVHCDVKPQNILMRSSAGERSAVLVDLGLSAARGVAGLPRGTPAYMPREALAGRADPRSDLYSLGASLYHAAAGEPPFSTASARETVRAICERAAEPIASRAPDLPAPLSELIDRLLAPEPASRPSSASVLLDLIAGAREALDLPRERRPRTGATGHTELPPVLLPPRLIGREALSAALEDALGKIGDPGQDFQLVRLIGPPGSGRGAVADEAVRRHQLRAAAELAPAVEVLRGGLDSLVEALGGDDARAEGKSSPSERERELEGDPLRFADRFLSLLAERARRARVLCVVSGEDARLGALLRSIDAGHPALSGLPALVVAPAPEAPARGDEAHGPEPGLAPAGERTLDLEVAPLDEAQIGALAASMLGREVDPDWAAELSRASGGLPRLAVEAVRAAAARSGLDDADTVPPRQLLDSAEEDAGLARLLVARVSSLPAPAAAVLEALAVHGGEASLEGVAATLERDPPALYALAADLGARGFLDVDGARLSLPSPAHSRALAAALPAARKRALHRAALRWERARDRPDPVAIAAHLVVTGPAADAARASLRAAELLGRRSQGRAALACARDAARLAAGARASEAWALVAERALAVGAYDEAESAARRAARSRDPGRRRRALFALARARQKRGDLEAAEEALTRLREADPSDEEAAGAYARLLLSRARHADALAAAGEPHREAPRSGALSRGRALRLEAAGLARLYRGELESAAAAFVRLEEGARASGDRALLGRALGLRGMTAQARGDIAVAAQLYAEAAEEARAAADVHAAAVYDLNQATAHSERGRFGQALAALGSALVELRRLGSVAELAAAQYNRGVALLALGEVQAARRAAERARTEADRHGARQMQVYADLLSGDVARREGDLETAAARYRRARDRAGERDGAGPGDRERFLASLNLAVVQAEAQERAARETLSEARALAGTDDDRDRLRVAEARVALALGDSLAPARDGLEEVAERSREAGRVDLAWRADVLAARLARACGDGACARERAGRARQVVDELCADAPEARRHGLRSDPDARALAALEADLRGSAPAPARPAPAAGEAGAGAAPPHLRRLLSLSRRLNSELRLEPLLDDVIDTTIELTAAERGFLLLFRPGGRTELDIVVARNIDQHSLAGEEIRLSRSIAERSARTGEVVLTVDAAFDDRFGAAESVAAMRLRSVLAVPLRQKGQIIGTIYVEHRFRRGAFDHEAVELTRELADIAGVAIENARLLDENRRRQEEIAELNRRLEADLGEKEAELLTVRARLADGDAGLRHAYDSIIGRSPPMLRMLEILDRATEGALPVVVSGESGTGKELVARALHQNGPRRERPFVAINCGAVPEQLLESELFGHIRGAFTGADRDRRGLFEVADGGTLFLDEVADTSLAMQAKLLRVLQEGEIRRVGDERARRVDVRIVAASNRDLGSLVAEGGFREDLFYRLHVLHVEVPPLRQRVEDIPALCEHLLGQLAGDGEPQRLDKSALARLSGYHWPGNVRELENELARASALGGKVIQVEDLSAHIADVAPPAPAREQEDLRLKPRVESLERSLVEEALRRTSGNQSAAARLLGLSRYGLQKKLKRYGISGSL